MCLSLKEPLTTEFKQTFFVKRRLTLSFRTSSTFKSNAKLPSSNLISVVPLCVKHSLPPPTMIPFLHFYKGDLNSLGLLDMYELVPKSAI